MYQKLRKVLGFIILISLFILIGTNIRKAKNFYGWEKDTWGYTYPVYAQQKFDLTCPSGTQPFSPLITNNPQTGNLKANACIDSSGTVTFQGGGGGASLAGNVNAIYASPACPNPNSGNCFFTPANVQFCFSTHTTWTGATSNATVTCDQNPFVSSDIGKKMFGTNGCCAQLTETTGTVTLPVGTITGFTNSSTITVSFTGTSTACNTSACEFVWGTDDTSTLANAWSAVVASPVCKALVLPAGYMFTTSSQFLGGNPACPSTSSTLASVYGASQMVVGLGPAISVIVTTPDFNFASCSGGCFGGASFMQYINWSIFGAGNGATGAPSNSVIVNFGIESYAENFMIVGWGGGDSNLTGANVNGRYVHFRVNSGGALGCNTNQIVYFINSVCQYEKTTALQVGVGSSLFSVNSAFGLTGSTSPSTNIGGNWNSNNDSIAGAIGFANTSLFVNGGTVHIGNSLVTASSTTISNAAQISSSGSLFANNTSFNGSNASNTIINRVSGTFFDLNNSNTYLNGSLTSIVPTCAMTTGGGTGPSCTLLAGSSNEKGVIRMTPGTTPGTSGTTTLTFAGTFAGATNTTPSCNFNESNTGTGVWNAVSAAIQLNTRSTTAPVFAWNNTAALTAASTYDVDYSCIAR